MENKSNRGMWVLATTNLQTVKNKKKKNLADLERKTPSPQALPPAVGLKNNR